MNEINIMDIVKVARMSGVFVVIGLDFDEDDNIDSIEVVGENGDVHVLPRSYVYKTGRNVHAMLTADGYISRHGIKPEIQTHSTPIDDITESDVVTDVMDPEVRAMIEEMERKMKQDALLSELSERTTNGASKRKIHRTIRKLKALTEDMN